MNYLSIREIQVQKMGVNYTFFKKNKVMWDTGQLYLVLLVTFVIYYNDFPFMFLPCLQYNFK